jgi:alkylhydroperoxidase family enzyme
MGHTEMCLAVAGLKQDEVNDITRRLAAGSSAGDWAHFPPAERAALAFTRKQAADPASITDADVRELEQHYGPQRAWQVIFWASRCHYMTKVADAFQFPLEKENPFWSMPGAKKAK